MKQIEQAIEVFQGMLSTTEYGNHVTDAQWKDCDQSLSALRQIKEVDVEGLKTKCAPDLKDRSHNAVRHRTYETGWNDCLDHLTSNGYKIVKVSDG